MVVEAEPLLLVDWGTAICERTASSLGRTVRTLIQRYHPTLLLIEDPAQTRTSSRTDALDVVLPLVRAAARSRCPVQLQPLTEVLDTFVPLGAITKADINRMLVERFPELAAKLPPDREVWQSEDARQAIFDALASTLAHLESHIC